MRRPLAQGLSAAQTCPSCITGLRGVFCPEGDAELPHQGGLCQPAGHALRGCACSHDPKPDDLSGSDPEENGTPEHRLTRFRKPLRSPAKGSDPGARRSLSRAAQPDGKNITIQGLWLSDPNAGESRSWMAVVSVPSSPSAAAGRPIACWRACASRAPGPTGMRRFSAPIAARLSPTADPGQSVHVPAGRGHPLRQQQPHVRQLHDRRQRGGAGGALLESVDSHVTVSNSILWGNTPATVRTISGPAPR